MSLFIFLTVLQAIVAAALVVVVLMQRSEGGGLGIGGNPNGMMSARGAANFLSRATKWLAVAFVVLSIVLAGVAVNTSGSQEITSTLDRTGGDSIPADTAGDNAPLPAPAETPDEIPTDAPAG